MPQPWRAVSPFPLGTAGHLLGSLTLRDVKRSFQAWACLPVCCNPVTDIGKAGRNRFFLQSAESKEVGCSSLVSGLLQDLRIRGATPGVGLER